MKVRDILNQGIEKLEAAGVENAAFDARQLLMRAYGKTSAELLMDLNRSLCGGHSCSESAEDVTYCPGDCGARLSFDALIKKRVSRIPLQHILGEAEFMGLSFRVTPDVLIPRQDTETLVECVLEQEKDKETSLLDICTGSGCIAVSLKHHGAYREVAASDISSAALLIARENAKKNEAEICFIESDLYAEIPDKYDVIVSNPPYIRSEVIPELAPEVREHDPMLALDGGTDGLVFYRAITEGAPEHLNPGGRLYFEIGFDQADDLCAIMTEHGFTDVKVVQDLTGLDRVVCGRLD